MPFFPFFSEKTVIFCCKRLAILKIYDKLNVIVFEDGTYLFEGR